MKLKVGTDFSGVGSFDQALQRIGVDYETVFACDMDKYARHTYLLNFGTDADMELLKTKEVKKIDDIYYRGLVNTKLKPPTEEEWQFVKDNEERVARLFSFYYPWNVYSRVIPEESLDVSVHTCPCQAFSLAGKRKGEEDRRGILFYNSHEFIAKNLPKSFIFENVKGLLSDDKGKTFGRWIDLLGGKSVNGQPVLMPHVESVPYHIYYKVLNAKEHGVPQNRERIFIIGIRDDEDDIFSFPNPIPLEKRLKDVLEKPEDFESFEVYSEYMEKYFLSENMIECLLATNIKHEAKGNGFKFECKSFNDIANSVTTKAGQRGTDNFISEEIIQLNDPIHSNDRVYSEEGISPTLNTMQGGNRQPFVQVSDEYKILGYTRDSKGKVVSRHEKEFAGTITTSSGGGGSTDQFIVINSNTKKGFETAEEEEEDSINFSVPTSKTRRGRVGKQVSQTLDTQCNQGIYTRKRIRRLTERECFNLMDFNKDIPGVPDFKWEVSSTQAYKQAGNSVVVKHFVDLIENLGLKK